MVEEVDAVWLGDASGCGEDHFDLVAPGLEQGPADLLRQADRRHAWRGRRKILEFARKHKAPIMSSSLFRHEWGMEQALRMRDAGEFGPLQYVIASQGGGYTPDGWFVYGQHPVWTVMTLCGPGVEAVSMYARENACHALVTYPDRMPAEVWYGRPDVAGEYCSTVGPLREEDLRVHAGHRGRLLVRPPLRDVPHGRRRSARWCRRGKEPVPHQEILEVTAIIHAGGEVAEGEEPAGGAGGSDGVIPSEPRPAKRDVALWDQNPGRGPDADGRSPCCIPSPPWILIIAHRSGFGRSGLGRAVHPPVARHLAGAGAGFTTMLPAMTLPLTLQ